MCSIDRYGNCTNWYCSCPVRVYGIHLKKIWPVYEIEDRSCWNRVVGWFINLYRKPTVFQPPLFEKEHNIHKTEMNEIRRKYGLLEEDCENI